MAADSPWRHSLKIRLLGGTILVAICSITATAWLSVQGTTGSIQQERGQELATDTHIYDTLLGYGATHPNWDAVEPVIAGLREQTGLRIDVTSGDRVPIARSEAGTPLPAKASAVIDPLAVDVTLQPGAGADRIDARAVGPFLLPVDERTALRSSLEVVADCLRTAGHRTEVADTPSGRPVITSTAPAEVNCARNSPIVLSGQRFQDQVVPSAPTEQKALEQLDGLVNACLSRKGRSTTKLGLTYAGKIVPMGVIGDQQETADCVATARREQLLPYVAPVSLLFISSPSGQPSDVGLSSAGTARIVGAAVLVLVLTAVVSILLAGRVIRPLRTLTVAAQRMRAGDSAARATVKARWEVAELAEAFNQMSEHLARTERQRKELVSDVSHELRTPLGNIRGWLVAAQDGVADLDPALVSSLLEETLLLQHLVDDLQELALADAGELRLFPEPVDIGDLLDQVAAAHGAELVVEKTGDLDLYADPVRLRQAVGNLVVNAVRHTPAGGRITLRGREHGDHVLIEVSDTGSGIDPGHLPQVFDRFWRAERSRNRQTGGSGLGLAIVRHLVEAHGGTVSVASALGVGTTFTLKLAKNPS
ncbi:ATP-binding protein [Amycolatopsis sp. NPDC051071]|uniref:sensor histidine kinase n=1 Tax=Amycolatopsis sp. NPDC051071 TaxID=3154637 RepID=UPI00344056EA